jgi:hypothetical protein
MSIASDRWAAGSTEGTRRQYPPVENHLEPKIRNRVLAEAAYHTDAHPDCWNRSTRGYLLRNKQHIQDRIRVWKWLRERGWSYPDMAEITLGRRGSHATILTALQRDAGTLKRAAKGDTV